jgi:hypothetical protein
MEIPADQMDAFIADETVPVADKLLLGLLAAGYGVQGQSDAFDNMAITAIEYLVVRHPNFFPLTDEEG